VVRCDYALVSFKGDPRVWEHIRISGGGISVPVFGATKIFSAWLFNQAPHQEKEELAMI
jgi:hypothetical protein